MSADLTVRLDTTQLKFDDRTLVVQQAGQDVRVTGFSGPMGPPGTGGVLGYYGAFSDYTTQTATANTATAMLLGTTDESNGVSIVSGSRITFANAGTYNLQWSAQFVNTGAADHDVSVWMRKNGIDVPGSRGVVSVPGKHAGLDGHVLPSWNFVFTVAAGDYYQFYWSTPDADVTIKTFPTAATPTRPSTASVVVTATQVMYTQQGPQGPQGPQGADGTIRTRKVVSTSTYTLLASDIDKILDFTNVAETITVTVPLLDGVGIGRTFELHRILSGTLTIVGASSGDETVQINGSDSVSATSTLPKVVFLQGVVDNPTGSGNPDEYIAWGDINNTVKSVAVTAPITNSGTSTSPTIGVSAGTTSAAGVVQLTDSTTSTSTTTAATPNSVKVAIDRFGEYLHFLTTTIDVFSRSIPIVAVGNTSGTARVTYFTATHNMTVSQITFIGGTTVSAGLTLARFGLYDATSLVARTASDTTLFNSASTVYTRSFDTAGGYPATFDLVAGTRYGVGLIVIGTTPGNALGVNNAGGTGGTYLSLSPRVNGILNGASDLPTTPPTGTNVSLLWARLS